MEKQGKPRIYLRKVQASKKGFGSEMTMWLWMGQNPAGRDWSLGCVSLFTLEEAMRHYARHVRALVNRGAPVRHWLDGRTA